MLSNILLSWLVPFALSVVFFDQTGQLWIDKSAFMIIMLLFATPVMTMFLCWEIKGNFSEINVLRVSLMLFAANCVLDNLILLPLSGMPFAVWWSEIGILYLQFPIIGTLITYLAQLPATGPGINYVHILIRSPLPFFLCYMTTFWFFNDKQQLILPEYSYKSIMVVITMITHSWFFFRLFKDLESLRRYGIQAISCMVFVQIILDIVVLAPVFKWTLPEYFQERGLRNLAVLTLGYVSQHVSKRQLNID